MTEKKLWRSVAMCRLVLAMVCRVDPVVELVESPGLPFDVNQNGGYSSVVMIHRVLEPQESL